MPPPTRPPSTPAERLEALGLPTRDRVEIRSSDYNTALSNPFIYFLTRRLGLCRALSWSKALSRGSWFHLAFCTPASSMPPLLESRLVELREICRGLGLGSDKTQEILERERKDYACALGWHQSSQTIPLPDGRGTYPAFLSDPDMRVLGRELLIQVRHPVSRCPLVIQLDVLLCNVRTGKLWPLDVKTCSEPTIDRLSRCPIEFQSQHYSFVTRTALDQGVFDDLFRANSIEPRPVFGGFIHLAVRKPTIEFGMNDRAFTWTSAGVRKKKNGRLTLSPGSPQLFHVEITDTETGEVATSEPRPLTDALEQMHKATGKKPEKSFDGEPSLDLYIERCEDWYHGRNDYEHLRAERASDPVVNLSFLPARWLDAYQEKQYLQRLQYVESLACRPADPEQFLKADYVDMSDKNPYADFHVNPIEKWPDIIVARQLVQRHRDEHALPDPALSTIAETP